MSFVSNSFLQINSQAGVPQDHAHQEAKTDLSLCSQVYNDESSLGLRGIKWVRKRPQSFLIVDYNNI